MKTYTDCLLAREAGRGLIRGAFTFGDWLAGDGMTPQSRDGGTEHDYITNLFLWRDLSVCASAAAALGNSADVCRYEAAADRVRRAFLDEYFTPGGRLCVDTQTAHVLSLGVPAVPDARGGLRRACPAAGTRSLGHEDRLFGYAVPVAGTV